MYELHKHLKFQPQPPYLLISARGGTKAKVFRQDFNADAQVFIAVRLEMPSRRVIFNALKNGGNSYKDPASESH